MEEYDVTYEKTVVFHKMTVPCKNIDLFFTHARNVLEQRVKNLDPETFLSFELKVDKI